MTLPSSVRAEMVEDALDSWSRGGRDRVRMTLAITAALRAAEAHGWNLTGPMPHTASTSDFPDDNLKHVIWPNGLFAQDGDGT